MTAEALALDLNLRARIERAVAMLIDLLDAIDAPATDLEPEEDCCAAGDDCSSQHGRVVWNLSVDHRPGDPDDAEDDDPAGGNTDERTDLGG